MKFRQENIYIYFKPKHSLYVWLGCCKPNDTRVNLVYSNGDIYNGFWSYDYINSNSRFKRISLPEAQKIIPNVPK